MISIKIFNILVISWIIFGAVLFPFIVKITAPYGRHSKSSWGPMISNRWGWIIMEMPALAVFSLFVLLGKAQGDVLIWIFFGFWFIHYFNRVLIFPFRTRTQGKKMPVAVMFMALFFNLVNGFINGYWLGFLSPTYPLDWFVDPRFIGGVVLFITGMAINMTSDQKLMQLRKGGRTGYFIPDGGLFKYVSCPNFMGEIIEWGGFALMTWSLPTLSFFLWTVFNLVPRALQHHKWYRKTFPDYPAERKAVIPYIL